MLVRDGLLDLAVPRAAIIGSAALACLALGAGTASAQNDRVIAPKCGSVFGGEICVGGTVRGKSIQSITATVPLSVIRGTPPMGAMTWPPQAALVLPLPANIQTASGAQYLTFYWEPMGHPPGPFLTPHFDFHFYVVDNAERERMDCKNDREPKSLPAGYSLLDVTVPGIGLLKGTCIPLMGMHALPTAELRGTKPFKAAMVAGYYDGKPIFFEPMIARATLLGKKNFSLAVPRPAGLPSNVHYPRRFTATYNHWMKGYRFKFTGFR